MIHCFVDAMCSYIHSTPTHRLHWCRVRVHRLGRCKSTAYCQLLHSDFIPNVCVHRLGRCRITAYCQLLCDQVLCCCMCVHRLCGCKLTVSSYVIKSSAVVCVFIDCGCKLTVNSYMICLTAVVCLFKGCVCRITAYCQLLRTYSTAIMGVFVGCVGLR